MKNTVIASTKRICLNLTILILTLAFCLPNRFSASKISQTPCDWYPKFSSKGGSPTVCPEAAAYFDKYDAFFMGDPNSKKVYLTFDSGYENGYTVKILDILKQENINAAFFLDGHYLRSNPEIVNRIYEEGHLLCNHTLKHPDMTKLTDFNLYKMQLIEWENICATLGVSPVKLYRPPSGRFSELTLEYDRALGYKTAFWSVAYADWDVNKQPQPVDAMNTLLKKAHNGAIYLLHSVSSTNAEILPGFIEKMHEMGYEFASLSDFN